MAEASTFGEPVPHPTTPFRLAGLVVLASVVAAALVSLGAWQVHRRGWKHELIARVDRRIHAQAVDAPNQTQWPRVTAAADEYLHVRASGFFDNDRETLVQAVTDLGAGFWVLTPLHTGAGWTVLVNRGFVPADHRGVASRAAGEIAGVADVTGLLRMTEPNGAFLRSNDAAADRWYSRDVKAIAAARRLPEVAPYFIDADATPNQGGYPVGGLTAVVFSDNHLVYALTWFSLAAMLAAVVAKIVRDEWRRSDERPAR